MSPEYGYSDDPEHRTLYPGRRCVLATAECKGSVGLFWGKAQLCGAHWLEFGRVDDAGTLDRIRAWVVERKRGAKTQESEAQP